MKLSKRTWHSIAIFFSITLNWALEYPILLLTVYWLSNKTMAHIKASVGKFLCYLSICPRKPVDVARKDKSYNNGILSPSSNCSSQDSLRGTITLKLVSNWHISKKCLKTSWMRVSGISQLLWPKRILPSFFSLEYNLFLFLILLCSVQVSSANFT